MCKLRRFIFLVMFLPLALYSQDSRHSMDISFGYNFNAPFTYSDNSYELVNIPEDLENSNFTEVVAALRNGGYGKGMSMAVNYHYHIKENLRLNGGVRYHKMPQENYIWRPEMGTVNLKRMSLYKNERSANAIQVQAGIGFESEITSTWSLTADINLITGLAKLDVYMLSEDEFDPYGIHTVYTDMKVKYFDGIMLGFHSSLTLRRKLTDNIDVIAGLDFRLVNHQQRDATIKNAILQGEMEVENYPWRGTKLSEKSLRDHTIKAWEIPMLHWNRPFSSYGLRLGVGYSF